MTILLIRLLPFFIPFAAYFLWQLVFGNKEIDLRNGPWLQLSVSGVVFVVIAMVLLRVILQGSASDGTYIPPYMDNGTLIQGQVLSESSGQ